MSIDVAEIFDEISKTMQADFESARKALSHAGLKGGAFEEVVRCFLRKYLPKSLDISTGMLIGTNGQQSRQLDIIISDAAKTPILFERGGVRVIPIECVYAVIEVKAMLGSEELNRAFDNMRSVRALTKEAYYKEVSIVLNSVTIYGKTWEIWPVNYFIFAFDSIDMLNLANQIAADYLSKNLPEWSRIDSVCVLNKGLICNIGADGGLAALSEPGSQLVVRPTNRALLVFYALIAHLLNQATMPRFNFNEYMRRLSF